MEKKKTIKKKKTVKKQKEPINTFYKHSWIDLRAFIDDMINKSLIEEIANLIGMSNFGVNRFLNNIMINSKGTWSVKDEVSIDLSDAKIILTFEKLIEAKIAIFDQLNETILYRINEQKSKPKKWLKQSVIDNMNDFYIYFLTSFKTIFTGINVYYSPIWIETTTTSMELIEKIKEIDTALDKMNFDENNINETEDKCMDDQG